MSSQRRLVLKVWVRSAIGLVEMTSMTTAFMATTKVIKQCSPIHIVFTLGRWVKEGTDGYRQRGKGIHETRTTVVRQRE